MGRYSGQDKRGFTLIELLIVVAIIGLLAAIAVPNLMSGQQRARYSRSAGDTREIITQAQVLMGDTNQVVNAACGNPMPRCLWDGSAPNGLIYMSVVTDPWAPPRVRPTVGIRRPDPVVGRLRQAAWCIRRGPSALTEQQGVGMGSLQWGGTTSGTPHCSGARSVQGLLPPIRARDLGPVLRV